MAVVTKGRPPGTVEPEFLPNWQDYRDDLVRRAVTYASEKSAEVAERLAAAGVEAHSIQGLSDLASIPVLSKDSLPDLQAASPRFAGMLAVSVDDLKRIFTSPGPILDPQGPGADFWRVAPALRAAGFTPGQVVLNTFSYHLTPGGLMLDGGLRAVGCVVVPGGVGNSAAQVEVSRALGATGYVGTPQFLLVLLEKAVEMGTPLELRCALVTGGPFPPLLREEIQSVHGIDAFESYGTADAGTLGYECAERSGWHVAPGVAIEITDPATGEPLARGETGEVVVTSPNETYPLVRFGTGDLSAFLEGACPCGRTSARLKGFLGRVGEGVKVKGMFVHPRQIVRALESDPGAGAWQGTVTAEGHQDRLTIRVEARDGATLDGEALERSLVEAVKVRLEVQIVPPGTIGEGEGRLLDERVH